MSERLFTIEEANALIPKLEVIMERLQRHRVTLRTQIEELAQSTGCPPTSLTATQILELRPQLQQIVEEIEVALEEIRQCGGHFKGLDLGLVDFPAERNGKVILLCWQYGEKEIGYYHTLEGGFAGRKPLHAHAGKTRYLQ